MAICMCMGDRAHAHERFPVVGALAFHPEDASYVVARASFGLLLGKDAGAHWSWICQPAMQARERDDPSVAIATDGELLAAQIAGLARSIDGGCEWTFPEAGLSGLFVADLAVRGRWLVELGGRDARGGVSPPS